MLRKSCSWLAAIVGSKQRGLTSKRAKRFLTLDQLGIESLEPRALLAAVPFSEATLAAALAPLAANTQNDMATVDLSVAISSTASSLPAQGWPGKPAYTITVTNNGPGDATGVVLSDVTTLESGVTVYSVVAAAGTSFAGANGTGAWTVGDLASGASATLVVSLYIDPAAPAGTDVLGHRASVITADQTLINTDDDSASTTTSVVRQADLHIQTVLSSAQVTPGGNIFYTVVVANFGPSDPGVVTLTQELPAGTTFVSLACRMGGWSTTTPDVGSTGQITLTRTRFGSCGAGSIFDFVLKTDASLSEGTILPITTTVSSSIADPNPSNNSTTASFTVHLQPGSFTQMVATGFPEVSEGSSAWGDYDNDGNMDLAISGFTPTGTTVAAIYHNDGNGQFHDIGASLAGVFLSAMAWGDYDNDGRLDLLVAGQQQFGSFSTILYHNDGNGQFHEVDVGLTDVRYGSVNWGDYDNDGRIDILLTGEDNSSNYITRIYHNDGDNRFHDIVVSFPGVRLGAATWADYDGDGQLDVLVAGQTAAKTSTTQLYHNDGNGRFHDIQAGLTGVRIGSSTWADYDNDGLADIFLCGITDPDGALVSKIYHNDGNGRFHDIQADLPGACNSSVAWGDYDNDGRLDLLLTGLGSRVYHNDGNGRFRDINAELARVSSGTADWWDMDGDGRLDILMTGITTSGRGTTVYRNTILASNASPSTPIDLTEQAISSTSATLSWTPATDDHTPSAGLSYDLRIGTAPAQGNVASVRLAGTTTASAQSTSRRNLPQAGAIRGNHYTITGLTPGTTYYWSVQAVDGALTSSAFSASHSFVFTGNAPAQATVTTPVGVQAGNISISYRLRNSNSAPCRIAVQYSPDGGATWKAASAGLGGNGTTNLASSASGVAHTFVWASRLDLAGVRNSRVLIRITPTDTAVGVAGTTTTFIVDNGPRRVSIDSVRATDGTSGWKLFTFHVTVSAAPLIPITVHFATQDGTAKAAKRDYTATSGTLVFAAGTRQLTKTITVSVRGTTAYRNDKTFSVVLSNSNAVIAAGVGLGTILNDAPVPKPIVKSVSLKEGASGQTKATFVVTLSGPSERNIPLTYATADRSAKASDNDHRQATGSLVFPAGKASLPITVLVNGDTLYENNETFVLNVRNALGIGSTGVCTIINDDRAPSRAINWDKTSTKEAATDAALVQLPWASVMAKKAKPQWERGALEFPEFQNSGDTVLGYSSKSGTRLSPFARRK